MAHKCVPQTKLWGSAEDLHPTSCYEALSGEKWNKVKLAPVFRQKLNQIKSLMIRSQICRIEN